MFEKVGVYGLVFTANIVHNNTKKQKFKIIGLKTMY